jgi:hypothetical protein
MSMTGDLISNEFQYEFRGLLFGSGTDIIVEEVQGLLGMPDVSNTDMSRLSDHGATPGVSTFGKRTIGFDLHIVGGMGEDIEVKLNEAQTAFTLPRRSRSRELDTLAFWRPGAPKKVVYGRCERREFVSNFRTARGLASGSIDIVCPDPLIYSQDTYEEVITLAPGAVTGQIEVWCNGNHPEGAYPMLTIEGPSTDANITNSEDDNRQLKLSAALSAAQVLTFNGRTMETLIDGVDAFTYVRNDSQFWRLLPGKNVIVYTRSAANAGATSRLYIRWQDTWQ